MNLAWYLNRLKKMSFSELLKSFREYLYIFFTRIKYHNPEKWPYNHFAFKDVDLVIHPLPGIAVDNDWKRYRVYNFEFDLTKSIDWYFSERNNAHWPDCHYAKINYRSGNSYGDVRINWELNRLQFLPAMAVTDEGLTKTIIANWLEKNPYLHGPGYLSSMEVALRWISIYRAVCLLKNPLEFSLRQNLTGLAVSSGKFIENRLSTHSSAGNHIIVEAVGLFWLGKALENNNLGIMWMEKARYILWEQMIKQIHPDGSNHEQTYWYLGFVLDAFFHYLLLEDRAKIPSEVWNRAEKILQFINDMTLSDGSYPDYGDRDDGFVLRLYGTYDESPFPGLLNIGASFFNQPGWYRAGQTAKARLNFWGGEYIKDFESENGSVNQASFCKEPLLKTYQNGGMTLMKWRKAGLLFRHTRLGMDNTYGHGHADALSVLFSWGNTPVLIDLGSGQYNDSQDIRNFFRSTIAHNTVEIGGKNQAEILGPFLWEKSYETNLQQTGEFPVLFAEANHDGYVDLFSTIHTRKVKWLKPTQWEITDSFSGPGGIPMRGAFHFGKCKAVTRKENTINADFDEFIFSLSFPADFLLKIFYGSNQPFVGWKSTVYGKWEPIYSIVYSRKLIRDYKYLIALSITEKN